MNNKEDILNPNKKYVSGPVNVARLEGEVDGIKKVIYLFMDFHADISQQLECSNIHAKHINTFLIDNLMKIKDSGEMIDVFLEEDFFSVTLKDEIIPEKMINVRGKQWTKKYIKEVLYMFKKMFNYKSDVNKVFKSSLLENLRIHYIDPRNIFVDGKGNNIFAINLYSRLIPAVYNIYGNQSAEAKQHILFLKGGWEYFLNVITDCIKSSTSCNIESRVFGGITEPDKSDSYIKHIFHKMIHKYNNPDIKKIMVSHLNVLCEKIKAGISSLNDLYHLFDSLNNKYVSEIGITKDADYSIKNNLEYSHYYYNDLQLIDDYEKPLILLSEKIYFAIQTGIIFMDIFFLRRFLDKNYITKVIAYTGAHHSANYIKILIQDFDFKLTHIAESNDKSIKELNEIIKNEKDLRKIESIVYPKVFTQCSDLTNFPENFE